MKTMIFLVGIFLFSCWENVFAWKLSSIQLATSQPRKTEIKVSELPIVVREVMKTEGFRGWKPTEIYRVEDRVTYFEIHLENAQAQKSMIKLTELGREIR